MNVERAKLDSLNTSLSIGIMNASEIVSETCRSSVGATLEDLIILSHQDGGRLVHESIDVHSHIIEQKFFAPFVGKTSIVFPDDTVSWMIERIKFEDEDEDGSASKAVGLVSEVGNLLINGVLGSIVTILGCDLSFQVPNFYRGNGWRVMNLEEGGDSPSDSGSTLASCKIKLNINEEVMYSYLYIVLGSSGFDALVKNL